MRTLAIVSLALVALALTAPAATNEAASALQNGLFEEEANHNLDAAIQAYQGVVGQFDKDRKLAATAIFRLGECYRKQGNTNRSVAAYERVVREFPDQPTLVTLSRQNLAGMGAAIAPAAATVNTSELASREAALASLKAQIHWLSGLSPEQQRIAVQQRFSNPVLTSLMQKLADAEQNLAALEKQYGPSHPEVLTAKAVMDTTTKQCDAQVQMVLNELVNRQHSEEAALESLRKSTGQVGREGPSELSGVTSSEAEEVKRIQAMIKDSPDLINARDQGGETPLGKAAMGGQIVVAQFLLQNGAEVDERNTYNDKPDRTPLHRAAEFGHKAMVELLLQHKADIEAKTRFGETPLHLAARKGYRSVLETLLAHGASVSAKSDNGHTPLHEATLAGQKGIAEVLLNAHADVNARDDDGRTPLHLAARDGQIEMAKLLLAHGAEVNAKATQAAVLGWTPLHEAIHARKTEMVALLLQNHADPNARTDPNYRDIVQRGYTPLLMATTRNEPEIIDTLLAFKADPNLKNPDGRTPIFNVINNEYSMADRGRMLAALLEHGADPNVSVGIQNNATKMPDYPLNDAVGHAGTNLVAMLLKHGADPNLQTGESSPLMQAVQNARFDSNRRKPELVLLLLDYKANPNVADASGQTPLFYTLPLTGIVERLLAATAGVNATNNQGETPLHWAAGARLKTAAELLLEHGADINAQDHAGNTPLHFAVLQHPGDAPLPTWAKEMVDFLLSKGADPNIRNKDGKTPLDWAKSPPSWGWFNVTSECAFVRPGYGSGAPPTPLGSGAVPVPGGRYQPRPGVGTPLGSLEVEDTPVVAALKSHGATEDLADLSALRVTRKGADASWVVFKKDARSLNHFSLLETLGSFYSSSGLFFPDFARMKILRPDPAHSGARREMPGAVMTSDNTFDCSQDTYLLFGDVLDIPEREHTLAEPVVKLTDAQAQSLRECLQRKVKFIVRGQPTEVTLRGFQPEAYLSVALKLGQVQQILRSSSDFSQVRVKRTDPRSQKVTEITEDVRPFWNNTKPVSDDLWLREGDVVEVPDKS
jgi:cytohesin